jgi:hypothetical protein
VARSGVISISDGRGHVQYERDAGFVTAKQDTQAARDEWSRG